MTIFFLAGEASSLFRHFWLVTLISVVGMVLSISIQYFFFERQRWQVRHFVVFAPLIFSFLTLLWGTVFRARPEAAFAALFLLAFIVIQLIASIWVVWKMKGFRWFSVFAVVLQLLFGFGCVFVSGMSITGDWM